MKKIKVNHPLNSINTDPSQVIQLSDLEITPPPLTKIKNLQNINASSAELSKQMSNKKQHSKVQKQATLCTSCLQESEQKIWDKHSALDCPKICPTMLH